MVRGDEIQDLFAAGRVSGINPIAGPVELWVKADDEEIARSLLEDTQPASGATRKDSDRAGKHS